MHLFARRSYTDAKVPGFSKKFGHVNTGRANAIIVTIDGFEVLGHMLIDLSFEILDCARGATIKLIVNLDGDFFHAFKVALKSLAGQEKLRNCKVQKPSRSLSLFSWRMMMRYSIGTSSHLWLAASAAA